MSSPSRARLNSADLPSTDSGSSVTHYNKSLDEYIAENGKRLSTEKYCDRCYFMRNANIKLEPYNGCIVMVTAINGTILCANSVFAKVQTVWSDESVKPVDGDIFGT